VGTDEIVQFTFGSDHILERPETFDMGCPDVRDQSEIGLGNLTQLAYFTGMVGPHLDHTDLVRPVDREQGERNADVVVVVSLGEGHLELLGEDGCHQLLRGSLTVCAGNSHNGYL
jgi:hypothetical protein